MGRFYIKEEKILTGYKQKNGYIRVNLCKNTKKRFVNIHVLVAETFIKNEENKPEVNHKNGNRSDNRVNNLEWVTDSENKIHSYTFLSRKTNAKKIAQYDLQGNFIREWGSIKEAQLYIKKGHISECCRGKYKSIGGFIWRYVEEDKK